jgi:hypothetical protein
LRCFPMFLMFFFHFPPPTFPTMFQLWGMCHEPQGECRVWLFWPLACELSSPYWLGEARGKLEAKINPILLAPLYISASQARIFLSLNFFKASGWLWCPSSGKLRWHICPWGNDSNCLHKFHLFPKIAK